MNTTRLPSGSKGKKGVQIENVKKQQQKHETTHGSVSVSRSPRVHTGTDIRHRFNSFDHVYLPVRIQPHAHMSAYPIIFFFFLHT